MEQRDSDYPTSHALQRNLPPEQADAQAKNVFIFQIRGFEA